MQHPLCIWVRRLVFRVLISWKVLAQPPKPIPVKNRNHQGERRQHGTPERHAEAQDAGHGAASLVRQLRRQGEPWEQVVCRTSQEGLVVKYLQYPSVLWMRYAKPDWKRQRYHGELRSATVLVARVDVDAPYLFGFPERALPRYTPQAFLPDEAGNDARLVTKFDCFA